MNNFSKLKNYIVDSEFRITFFENKIHVVNYLDLVTLGSNQNTNLLFYLTVDWRKSHSF